MSKRVSNKKAPARRGVKPARSGKTWRKHLYKLQRRREREFVEQRRLQMIEDVKRRFKE